MEPPPENPLSAEASLVDGYTKLEGAPFWHTVGKQEAARQMRIWISGLASRGEL